MTELVRFSVQDGVATILLDRPKVNALSVALQDQIRDAARQAATREDVRAVVVHGGPRVFAAGADIVEMAAMTHADMVARGPQLQACFAELAAIPKPTVSAINGYALGGGCELAMCTDFRIAGQSAKLGQPEVLLGVIPGAGGTQRLTRLVGVARAKELIYSGRIIDADEALAIGLVDEVVPDESVYDVAVARMSRYVGGAPLALAAAKAAIDGGLDGSLADGLARETELFAGLFATRDREIGMTSFVENGPGKAVFEGR